MIEIGSGIWEKQKFSNAVIISDDRVAAIYYRDGVPLVTFPHGEKNKTRETKEMLENQLFTLGFGKDTTIIALGGGVTTDMSGFIAATFCRGVKLVMVPTTLLGMVDACIGGKTGVNVPHGKNLVGCVYHPIKIIIDINFLKSLPQKEIASGSVEMIKHGLIADLSLFEFLESHSQEVLNLESDMAKAISQNCKIKQNIVAQDEKDKGIRNILNLGHTVAHALEKLTDFTLSHGEAVAIGLLAEGYMAVELGFLQKDILERIHTVLKAYRLPLCGQFDPKLVLEAMKTDKKSRNQLPRFALIERVGKPLAFDGDYCTHVDEPIIMNALNWMCNDLCCH